MYHQARRALTVVARVIRATSTSSSSSSSSSSILSSHSSSAHLFSRHFSRFKRAPAPSSAVTTQPKNAHALSNDILSNAVVTGDQAAQQATLRVQSGEIYKVDPSAIIAVSAGIEVRPVSGTSKTPAVGEAPVLAEISVHPGVQTDRNGLNVNIGPEFPAKLHSINLGDYGGEMMIQRGTYLASTNTVDLDNAQPTNIPGLSFQRLSGEGSAVLKVSGSVIERDLEPGEPLYVSANRLVAIESTVATAGGQGAMLTTLTGPGRVLLQSVATPGSYLADPYTGQSNNGMASYGNAGAGMPGFPLGNSSGQPGLGRVLAEGAAFGVGSAVAHRAVDSVLGPRTVNVEHTNAPPPPAAGAADSASQESNDLGYSEEMSDDSSEEGGGFFDSLFGSSDE